MLSSIVIIAIFEHLMEKSIFLSVLSKIKEISLPGDKAHATVAPPDRMQMIKAGFSHEFPPKQAAVIICCYPKADNSYYFPLILRTEYPGVHSGQISLPGGKFDDRDSSLWHTAIRELNEELGVEVENLEQIFQLSPLYIPPSNFWVTPYMAVLETAPFFIPEEREVARVIEMSLEDLTAIKKQEKPITNSYLKEKKVYGYSIDNQFVWGATAMILTELKMILSDVMRN